MSKSYNHDEITERFVKHKTTLDKWREKIIGLPDLSDDASPADIAQHKQSMEMIRTEWSAIQEEQKQIEELIADTTAYLESQLAEHKDTLSKKKFDSLTNAYLRSKEEVLRLKAIVEAKPPILPAIQQPMKRLSPKEVLTKVIDACKLAIANPQLNNRDLATLVGISAKTLEKHAKKITSARERGW